MRVIRSRETADYVQIADATVRDLRLSLTALGLLVYLLSRPDDWVDFDYEDLVEQGRCSPAEVGEAIGDLERCGYLQSCADSGFVVTATPSGWSA